MSALRETAAHDIYDVLVHECGASERHRDYFVHSQTTEFVTEFRFQGELGFGGKFWRNTGPLSGGTWGEKWYVNCYSEDETPTRKALIAEANQRLEGLAEYYLRPPEGDGDE